MPREIQGINFLDTKEISKQLGRTPRTVQFWIREGRLKAKKFGREYLVPQDDLDSFMKENIVPTSNFGERR